MIALDLLPDVVPTDELFLGTIALIVLVLVMNRGEWWFFNVKAQDEPLVTALGIVVFLLGWSGWLTSNIGASDMIWMGIGGFVSLAGLFVYRSDRYDISGLI